MFGTADVLELQSMEWLVEVLSISRKECNKNVSITDIYQHVLPQLAEAARSIRRNHAFEWSSEHAEFSFELLEDSKADAEVFDEVLTTRDVVPNLELAAVVLLLLHVLPDWNNKVIDSFSLVERKTVVFLVRMRTKESETIISMLKVDSSPFGLVITEKSLWVDG